MYCIRRSIPHSTEPWDWTWPDTTAGGGEGQAEKGEAGEVTRNALLNAVFSGWKTAICQDRLGTNIK
jgi:hypothetical protein|eukprot:COSAG06_NODE_1486_length_9299_cov_3.915435_11_plen_67_part_00